MPFRPILHVMPAALGLTLVATSLAARAAEPTPTAPVAADANGPGLTLDAALATARNKHPTLVRLRAQVKAASTRVDQLDAVLRPSVAGLVDFSVGATPPADFGDPTATVRAGVGASWTITDFGKNASQIRAGRGAVLAEDKAIEVTVRDIDQAVEEAYWNAVAQRDLVRVAQTTFESETRHREEAERFVKAGLRAPIEVARAKTQEARARTELVRAETAARLALVSLGRAMGGTVTPGAVAGSWSSVVTSEVDVDALVKDASERREEVVAQRERVRAAELAVAASERGLAPSVSADAQVGVGSVGLEEWGPSWTVGVTLNWPFYDGGRTELATATARAELETARSVVRELEVAIASEIGFAASSLASARAELEAADTAREAAQVELQLAEARWKEGLGSGIELADAQTRVALTAAERTRAELSMALAKVRLERARGR
ncbi:MAG: TolC family protein [Deltaproteobacteria bacterium]|nr:TolC family protein [Deltaproteobacteria bacterium]